MIYIISASEKLADNQGFDNKTLLVDPLKVDVSSLLSTRIHQHALVMYQNPAALIAQALRFELAEEELISLCIKQYKALIHFFKKNRENSTLVSADAVSHASDAFDEICDTLNIKLNTAVFEQLASCEPDIYTLAADHLVSQNKILQKIDSELKACSVLSGEKSDIKITDILSGYREENKSSLSLSTQQAGENEALVAQLHSVQEALEASLIQLSDAQKNESKQATELEKLQKKSQFDFVQAQKALQDQQAKYSKLEAQLAEIQDQSQQALIQKAAEHKALVNVSTQQAGENEALVAQLHSVQEALEASLIQLSDAQKNESKQATELEKLQKKSQLDFAQAEKALQDQQAECSKLEAQLAETQDQSRQALTQQAAEHKLAINAEQTELEKLQAQLIESQSENDSVIQHLHSVQEYLERTLIELNNEKFKITALKTEYKLLENTVDNNHTILVWLRSQLKTLKNSFYKNSRAQRRLLQRQIELIKPTGLFDEQWYLINYPDIAASKQEPLLHYLLHGAGEGRNPSPAFNTLNYLYSYSDVAKEGMNPLVHFIKFGKYEGRQPDPLQKRLMAPSQN